MQVVILAGGLGTRLRGAIPDGTPKPMAEVAGRPFLAHALDAAMARGADSFVLLLGYNAEVIRRRVGRRYAGAPVTCSVEPRPLGTGGALRHARPFLEERFVLLNGDTYAEVDYRRLIAKLDRTRLVMSLVAVDDTHRFGRVSVRGGVVHHLREKGVGGPGLINAGVYGCHVDLLDSFPATDVVSFEQDVLGPQLPGLRPRYELASSVFFDIGVPEDYHAADAFFREQQPCDPRVTDASVAPVAPGSSAPLLPTR